MESRRGIDPFAELLGELAERLRGDRFQPAVDVIETEGALLVRFEIAGVKSADLRVTVDEDVVRVSGVRTAPPTPKVVRLHQMEIGFGSFERSVKVNVPFDRDRVSANLEEGVLTVTLPRQQRHRIEVER